MRSSLLVAFACAAMLFVGCKPKAGGSCKVEAKEVCIGDKQALSCHEGKWEEMNCKGASGCTKNGSDSVCDQSTAEDKDVCNLTGDFVCTGDKKGMLECQKNNRWSFVQSCLGDRGCAMEQHKVTCDNSIANAGDGCKEEEDYACTPDHKSAVVCKSGKFTLASNCKGKNACKVTGDKAAGFKVECDDSIAAAGDPCDKENHFACASDEKTILKCVGKKFTVEDKCRPKEKCGVRGELVGCY